MEWNDILEFAREHRCENVRDLALKPRAYPGIDMPLALQQVAGWQIACDKLPRWAANDDIVYGPQLSMEQCSSQATALYKAALVEGDSIVDLTGGLGVDFSFMSQGRKGTYVEQQEHLCEIARHNFKVLGLDATVINGDGIEHLKTMAPCGTIYIDPARRDKAGNRVFALSDCTPDVTILAPLMLEKAPKVIIKLSPMLDHRATAAQLPGMEQIHIISVHGECKELLVVLRRDYQGSIGVHCVNDDDTLSFTLGEENIPATVWDEVSTPLYMYEPNASIMKAGCYTLQAAKYGLEVVGPDSHLLVGSKHVESFAGRAWAIEAVGTMNKKELKAFMQGVTKANVAVRNFPIKANELARRLRVNDGGDTYIIGTTTASGKHVLMRCRRL